MQDVLGVGWLGGQAWLQYQMPRTQVQRFAFASHRDSPAMLQAVPCAGSELTMSHKLFLAPPVPPVLMPPVAWPPVIAPPVAVPPVLTPPVAVPPEELAVPPAVP